MQVYFGRWLCSASEARQVLFILVKFIAAGTKFGVEVSPVVASFSSRGPNSITLQILKPNLIALGVGVNILAAFTRNDSPTFVSIPLCKLPRLEL